MVKTVNGDLLDAKEDIIAHQVNCQGVMGSGVAKQIKERFPAAYEQYKKYCITAKPGFNLLGSVQIVQDPSGKTIANLFMQDKYGTGKQHTDGDAMRRAFSLLHSYAVAENLSIAMPYRIGCGLGGGDWDTVLGLIEFYFHDVEVVLYRKENR